jgi:nucleotide-binding universal stress UspA family protein
MDVEAPVARRVFVLGRHADLDVRAEAGRAVEEGRQLVLLSVGYPVTAAQDAVVQDALHVAHDLRLWLDAILVPSSKDLADLVATGEEVTVVARGAERRKLERALHQATLVEVGSNGVPRRDPATGHPAMFEVVGASAAGSNGASSGPVPVVDHLAAPVTGSAPSDPEGPGGLSLSESVEALAGREVPQPEIRTAWTQEEARTRKRGRLIVYLGAAPGVGKTYAMLGEGQRAKARGTDVVVGVVQTYGRPRTEEVLRGLEVIPPKLIPYRGTTFEEMDVEALIARAPERALIDELAHTNIPGSRRAKRWEDVLDVLAEGISVITTLNVQHLASLNDVVAQVTGVRQQETVPDWVLDLADQVELIDMSPHALQRRMVHGNVYPDQRKAELALQRFFTMDNLTALRDLALMRVANQVDDDLLRRWSGAGRPDTRERILVCVSRPELSEGLVRRGARIAQRTRGDLLVAHASVDRRDREAPWLERIRDLTADLGGEFHDLPTDGEAVESILAFAYQQQATQIIVGESLKPRWRELLGGSFVQRLIRKASNIDVHVIARGER